MTELSTKLEFPENQSALKLIKEFKSKAGKLNEEQQKKALEELAVNLIKVGVDQDLADQLINNFKTEKA